MNETQYYSAKLYKEDVIVCPIDFHGEILYQVFGKIDYYTPKSYLDDLTPVKFAPQEAAVIEGVTAERFKAFLIHSQHDGCSDTYSSLNQWAETQRVLLAQLTPPKSRPVEPKPIYAKVTAICPCWSAPITWTLGADGNWHTCRNGKWENHAWESLSDPVVLSAGQVK